MPEAVEVKLITDQLAKYAVGKKLIYLGLAGSGGRYKTSGPEGFLEIAQALPLTIQAIKCKGKFIYWLLDKNWSIWNTLGMTGEWSRTVSKHSAMQFCLDSVEDSIYFTDPRHFGTLKCVEGLGELKSKLMTLGPDMLSSPPDKYSFQQIIKAGKSKTIVEILMDQSRLSGVGNYIKAESLYRAKLSPWRKCDGLNEIEMVRLYTAIISVMKESYALGGATLATYKNFEGNAGQFAKKFSVYKKKNDPGGLQVIRETTPDKRTTHWVPAIQL